MMVLWGTLIGSVSGAVGFYVGSRYIGTNLAKILARLTDGQLAALADEVSRERRRERTG